MNNTEEKAKRIIDDILKKYKKKIPMYSDTMKLGTTKAIPLQLSTLNCMMPKVAYLHSIIHEQLHLWYALRNIMDGNAFKYLKNKYIDTVVDEDGDLITNTVMKDIEMTDPKTGKVTIVPIEVENDDYDLAVNKYKTPIVLGGAYPTIEHIIVIWNELNVIEPLITKREYNWLYYKYKGLYKHSSLFKLTYWIMRNFKLLEYDLSRYNLIWSPVDIDIKNTTLTITQMSTILNIWILMHIICNYFI